MTNILRDALEKIRADEMTRAPNFRSAYLLNVANAALAAPDPVAAAYEKGRYDQRVEDALVSPAGRAHSG